MRWLLIATLAAGLCSATIAYAASPLDAPDPLAAPAAAGGCSGGCAGKDGPKIGPPIDTGGPAPCVSNVFEKGQGCICPPSMPIREEIGDPAKIGAEHVMVWCRRGGSRR